jgi:hypothetical protein
MRVSKFSRSLSSVLAAAAAVCSVAGCATDGAVGTRAQVRNDLATYRCAGFDPVADEITYPADVERAEARVAAGNGCPPAQRPAARP